MTTPAPDQTLRTLLKGRLDPAGWAWLEGAATLQSPGAVAAAYAAAGRHVGRAPLALTAEERRHAGDLPLDHWTVEDAARALLLITRFDLATAIACYELGDSSEQ